MNELGVMIAWCALQVTLFLLLAAPVYLLVRRTHPRAGTGAALGSLLAVIALSVLAGSGWPRWEMGRSEAWASHRAAVHAESAKKGAGVGNQESGIGSGTGEYRGVGMEKTSRGEFSEPSFIDRAWAAVGQLMGGTANGGDEVVAAIADRDDRVGRAWSAVIAIAGLGAIVGTAQLVGGLIAVRRLAVRSTAIQDAELAGQVEALAGELGISHGVAVRESHEVATPAVIGGLALTKLGQGYLREIEQDASEDGGRGWGRSLILLPTSWRSWSEVERESVLAHELAHIAERDFAAWVVARVAVALHFYHPLVRWFARRLQLDQELAADGAAVRLLGDRDEYLRALASLALATPMHRIAGPARTFIPSRSMLLRRVEMLRAHEGSRLAAKGRGRVTRWLAIGALAMLAVAAAGLRPGAQQAALAAENEAPTTAVEKESKADRAGEVAGATQGYDFSYVPKETIFVIALRPSEIAASPRLNSLAKLMSEASRPKIAPEKTEQVTLCLPAVRMIDGKRVPGSGSEYTILWTNEAVDFKPLIEESYGPIKTEMHEGREMITWGTNDHTIAFYAPNERMLVSHAKAGLIEVMGDPEAARSPTEAAAWQAEAKGPLFAAVNMNEMRQMMPREGSFAAIAGPVLKGVERLTVTSEDGEAFVVRATAECKSENDAALVKSTLESIVVLGRNVVNSGTIDGPDRAKNELVALGGKVLDAVKVEVAGRTVTATASVENFAAALQQFVIPALTQARGTAMRSASSNNLRQLALGMLNYESSHHRLPPAVVYGPAEIPSLNATGDGDAAKDVPRSWRVEILPYIEQQELYSQYRLDEPWDSEANLKVLAQMPQVFRAPEDRGSTNASYFAVTGPETVFDGLEGTKFKEIEDGTSHTLLLVEAKREIPWTKPEDVKYDPKYAKQELGGWTEPGEFLGALCDGSVQAFFDLDAEAWRRWVSKADGEPSLTPREEATLRAPPGK